MRDPLRQHEIVPSSKTLRVGDVLTHPDESERFQVIDVRPGCTFFNYMPSHHGGEDDCDLSCRDGVWLSRAKIHTLAG